MENTTKNFLLYLERHWYNSLKTFSTVEKNAQWLEQTFTIKKTPGPGAPVKSFEESGIRSKRQKVSEISSLLNSSSPNRTHVAAKKFIDSSFNSSANLSFSNPEPVKLILSAADSFDIFSTCKHSKSEYINLVNVLKTKGCVLKSYETIRSKFLKDQKSSLPVTTTKTSAVIDPSVSISNSFYRIFDKLDISCELSELDFGIKFGFDGAQSLQSIYFQNEVDQIDDKFMFLVYYCPVFIKKVKVLYGRILMSHSGQFWPNFPKNCFLNIFA